MFDKFMKNLVFAFCVLLTACNPEAINFESFPRPGLADDCKIVGINKMSSVGCILQPGIDFYNHVLVYDGYLPVKRRFVPEALFASSFPAYTVDSLVYTNGYVSSIYHRQLSNEPFQHLPVEYDGLGRILRVGEYRFVYDSQSRPDTLFFGTQWRKFFYNDEGNFFQFVNNSGTAVNQAYFPQASHMRNAAFDDYFRARPYGAYLFWLTSKLGYWRMTLARQVPMQGTVQFDDAGRVMFWIVSPGLGAIGPGTGQVYFAMIHDCNQPLP